MFFGGDEEKWLSAIKPGDGKKAENTVPMTTRVVLFVCGAGDRSFLLSWRLLL